MTLTVLANLLAVGTLHTKTGVVFTTVGFGVADTSGLASTVAAAFVCFTLAFDTNFASSTTNAGAGIDFTLAIHAFGAAGTLDIGAGFDAFAIGASTVFAACTGLVVTGRLDALAFETDFTFGAGVGFVVTTRREATTVHTGLSARTIAVYFTTLTVDTLTCNTLLCLTRTLHALAGVINTVAVLITDATVFAGAAVTGVFDTGGVGGVGFGVADLAFLTRSRSAGIGHTLTVTTFLTIGAGDTGTGLDTLAVSGAADLVGSALNGLTGVLLTLAADAEFTVFTGLLVGAFGFGAETVLTDLTCRAIAVSQTTLQDFDLEFDLSAENGLAIVTDLNLKVVGFSSISRGRSPGDFASFAVNGDTSVSFDKAPGVSVTGIVVFDFEAELKLLAHVSDGRSFAFDGRSVVGVANGDGPLLGVAFADLVADLDLKGVGLACFFGAGLPTDLAGLGVDGSTGGQVQTAPCVSVTGVGVRKGRFVAVSTTFCHACTGLGGDGRSAVGVQHFDGPLLGVTIAILVTDLDLKVKAFASISRAGSPLDFTGPGVDFGTFGRLEQTPCVSVVGVFVFKGRAVTVQTTFGSDGVRGGGDGRSVVDVGDFDFPRLGVASTGAVADFDGEVHVFARVLIRRFPCQFAGSGVQCRCLGTFDQFPTQDVVGIGVGRGRVVNVRLVFGRRSDRC